MDSARQFMCKACCALARICPDCDRGNRYCSKACASGARAERCQAAGRRYQSTRRGRLKNAERQARWRAAQLKK